MKTEFLWTGINTEGEKISGKIHADNKKIANQKLAIKNIAILSLKKNNAAFSLFQTNKFTLKNQLEFTQQLQLLLQASIPLSDALSLIIKTSQNSIVQSISSSLNEKIISGMNFSTALKDFPNYFNQTYCHIISAGEHSGQLEAVLLQLIENQEKQLQIKNRISKILFYPISVMCIAIAITVGLLIFVIPQFSAIYNNFGAQLPIMTRCIISISHHLSERGLTYIFIMAGIILFFKKIIEKNGVKKAINLLFFKIALSRSLIMTKQIAQWSQLLAMTLSSSIPLVDALHIANDAISQPILHVQMQQVRKAVIEGKSLRNALDLCQHFPLQAKTMIAIGESADSLSFMIKKIATLYQQQFNDTLDHLSKLLEPVIMIVVASLVSGLIIAMYLPIFKMGSVI